MSGPVDLGQTYRYRHTVKNAAAALANAGTVVVTITLPDGTTVTPAVNNSSAGVYDVSYLTTQAGLHNVSGSATGGILSGEFDKFEDAFTVETPGQMLVGVDEALSHLRAQDVITGDVDREQLRWLCLVATEAVEGDLDRYLVRRTVVKQRSICGSLWLRGPVVSVTSVTIDGGAAVDAAGYRVDEYGFLQSRYGWGSHWPGVATITYIAGEARPPRIVRIVALNLVQSLYQQSQQAFHPGLDESSAEAFATAALPGPGQIPGYDALRMAPGVA